MCSSDLVCGTPTYVAPEIIAETGYSHACVGVCEREREKKRERKGERERGREREKEREMYCNQNILKTTSFYSPNIVEL